MEFNKLVGGYPLGEIVILAATGTGKSTLMEPLPRKSRIDLAVLVHGLYTFGMATTDCERCDEDCAMDNMGIPYYKYQLTERDKEVLARLEQHGQLDNVHQ